MYPSTSPLESLAAFGLAFIGGIACGLALSRYARYIREDALKAITPAV
jgi:hypothetical protein